jgi:hypothetical protein
MLPAQTLTRYKAICGSPKSNPFIHNRKGWDLARGLNQRVLASCSDAALDELEGSMEFFAGGLASIKFGRLEREMGKEGVFGVLRLFGIGRRLAERSYNKGCNHVTGKCSYYKSAYCSGEPCGIIA